MVSAMRIRLPAILMIFAAMALSASAAPRMALVRVKDIYVKLASTKSQQEETQKERDEIAKDPRAVDLRRIIKELQELQARLSDKNNPLDEEAGRKLAQSYEIKRQEAHTLQKEFESFRSEREKEINRKMVAGMRASLNQIVGISRRIAKERGYDLVFDSSGGTNTGIPFVLYSGKSPDMTDDVMAALKDAEAAASKVPAPDKPPSESPKPANPKR